MKSPLLATVLAIISSLAVAQELPEEGEVIMISRKSPAEVCEGIMKRSAEPVFPTSLAAQHTVIKQGACSVELAFTVLESGDIEAIEVDTVEERCKPFVRASIAALSKSEFNKPKIKKYCYQTYTYELQ